MIENNSNPEKPEVPILTMIQQIKDGQLDPRTLNKELRQQCVEILLGEACSAPSIAQILKRSDKTIRRDIDEIRERNALDPDLNLYRRLAGEILVSARMHRDYLMRLARSAGASVGEKANCEYFASLAFLNAIARLQSLGILPTSPKSVVGDLYLHNENEEKSFNDLKGSVIEIEKIALESGISSEIVDKQIKVLKEKIEKKEIEEKIKDLNQQINKEDTNDKPNPESN